MNYKEDIEGLRNYLINDRGYTEEDLFLTSEKVVNDLYSDYQQHKQAKSEKLRAKAAQVKEARKEAMKDKRNQVTAISQLLSK